MKAGSVRVIRRAFTMAAAVMISGSTSALAAQELSPMAEEASMMEGAKLGILALLIITLAMQGAFVGFFLYLRKRAKRFADIDPDADWSEVQRSPKTS